MKVFNSSSEKFPEGGLGEGERLTDIWSFTTPTLPKPGSFSYAATTLLLTFTKIPIRLYKEFNKFCWVGETNFCKHVFKINIFAQSKPQSVPYFVKVRDKIAECSPAWKKYTTASYENISYAATLLFHGQNCLEMYVGSLWLDINKVSNPCSGYIPSTLNFNANENSESKGGSIINLSMIQSWV